MLAWRTADNQQALSCQALDAHAYLVDHPMLMKRTRRSREHVKTFERIAEELIRDLLAVPCDLADLQEGVRHVEMRLDVLAKVVQEERLRS
jgi:hypothetical protein